MSNFETDFEKDEIIQAWLDSKTEGDYGGNDALCFKGSVLFSTGNLPVAKKYKNDMIIIVNRNLGDSNLQGNINRTMEMVVGDYPIIRADHIPMGENGLDNLIQREQSMMNKKLDKLVEVERMADTQQNNIDKLKRLRELLELD